MAALSQDELKTKYEKYDLPKAKALMKEAGSSGFDVTMTTFSTPLDYAAMAALIKTDLAQIGINVNIVPQDSGHLRREERRGPVRLGSHRPRDAR